MGFTRLSLIQQSLLAMRAGSPKTGRARGTALRENGHGSQDPWTAVCGYRDSYAVGGSGSLGAARPSFGAYSCRAVRFARGRDRNRTAPDTGPGADDRAARWARKLAATEAGPVSRAARAR